MPLPPQYLQNGNTNQGGSGTGLSTTMPLHRHKWTMQRHKWTVQRHFRSYPLCVNRGFRCFLKEKPTKTKPLA